MLLGDTGFNSVAPGCSSILKCFFHNKPFHWDIIRVGGHVTFSWQKLKTTRKFEGDSSFQLALTQKMSTAGILVIHCQQFVNKFFNQSFVTYNASYT